MDYMAKAQIALLSSYTTGEAKEVYAKKKDLIEILM
jgi:hypothetical protein